MPGLGIGSCGGDEEEEQLLQQQQQPLHDIEDLIQKPASSGGGNHSNNSNSKEKRNGTVSLSITHLINDNSGEEGEEEDSHHQHHHNNNKENNNNNNQHGHRRRRRRRRGRSHGDDDNNVAVVVVKRMLLHRDEESSGGGGSDGGLRRRGVAASNNGDGPDDDGPVVRLRRRRRKDKGEGEEKKVEEEEVMRVAVAEEQLSHDDRCCRSSISNHGDDDDDDDDEGLIISRGNDINPATHTVYLKTWGCSHNNSDSEYMAGLLGEAGFRVTTTNYPSASIVILNSCTVKGPSEQHFRNEIDRAKRLNKHLILAGCVPQSDKLYRKVASVIGVQQIQRIVEVVEETLKGNKVVFLSRVRRRRSGGSYGDGGCGGGGADLSLPKIRKNELIEIIPVSSGCLNNCTYCKTKLARGQLGSYSVESIVDRIQYVIRHEGIKEIWLTSEDLGAWGIDLGLTIVDLLNAVVKVLESFSNGDDDDDGYTNHVMLRLGMTNPPYIMDHLEEISKILSHPNVYEFLHIPVQSGSDSVLLEMKREYGRKEFDRICDFMIERHPTITIATDIICGYPTETEPDFSETYSLVSKYHFPVLFINQFYPRTGTTAAKLKRLPTEVVKGRTRRLNELFQGYMEERSHSNSVRLVGSVQRVLVTEVAHDGVKLVGHNKAYQQVLVGGIGCHGDDDAAAGLDRDDSPSHHHHRSRHGNNNTTENYDANAIMGQWLDVKIAKVGKFSMIGGVGQAASVVGGQNRQRGITMKLKNNNAAITTTNNFPNIRMKLVLLLLLLLMLAALLYQQ